MRKLLIFAWVLTLPLIVKADGFTLLSPEISGQLSNKQVFNGFGCKGENISPTLTWENAPKGTKSFAITAYDPDAPTSSGWWHWLVFNIPKNINTLEESAGDISKNIAPKGSIQSTTSFGQKGFGGACPPPGDSAHKYIFTVHALKVEELELTSDATPALVSYLINLNRIGEASVIAHYGR